MWGGPIQNRGCFQTFTKRFSHPFWPKIYFWCDFGQNTFSGWLYRRWLRQDGYGDIFKPIFLSSKNPKTDISTEISKYNKQIESNIKFRGAFTLHSTQVGWEVFGVEICNPSAVCTVFSEHRTCTIQCPLLTNNVL